MSVQITSSGTHNIDGGARQIVRTRDNEIYVLIIDRTNEEMEMWKSTNEGVTWALADSYSFSADNDLHYQSCCLGPDGKIYCVYFLISTNGLIFDGLRMVVFDPATDTFGTPVYISSGVSTNTLPTLGATSCAISDDIDQWLHVAWTSARSVRGAVTESLYYTRYDVSGGGGSVNVGSIRSFYKPTEIIIEKAQGTRLPLIVAGEIFTGSGSTDWTMDLFYGNTELATSFTRKAGYANIARLGTVMPTMSLVEDNEGGHWSVYSYGLGGPDYNLEYTYHPPGTAYNTGYVTGEITSAGSDDYTYASMGTWGYGTTRNEKHFISGRNNSGTLTLQQFDDFNKVQGNQWNGPAEVNTGSNSFPRVRWSNYQHYSPHIFEWIYESGGQIFYDQKILNQEV